MSTRAQGSFEVRLTPQSMAEPQDGLARMALDKRFRGDLDATSKGEMLSAMSSVQGSAGYVAIERVSGTLAGKRGTFVLQHTGMMDRGAPSLAIVVVPDSGTGELAGLTGSMSIDIRDGQHFYAFDYAIG